jgi:hypothetical protein
VDFKTDVAIGDDPLRGAARDATGAALGETGTAAGATATGTANPGVLKLRTV